MKQEEGVQYPLEQSADLYAALYAEDADLQELTNDALAGWPDDFEFYVVIGD